VFHVVVGGVICREMWGGLECWRTAAGLNEASCLAGMINISALYDVVMWATTCQCVWLFHLPKQVRETPGDVMIGGAVRRASAVSATFDVVSAVIPHWPAACHPLVVGHCDRYIYIYMHWLQCECLPIKMRATSCWRYSGKLWHAVRSLPVQ